MATLLPDGSARRTYDADEAFALMGMPRSTGFDLIKRGQFPIPVIKAGRRIYIPKEPFDRLLAGEPVQASPATDQAA
jgi:hypothetical protein